MTMQIEDLVAPAVDWTGGSWGGRIDQAASLLFIQGYITQGQREKITAKLNKQYADGITAGRIVPKPAIDAAIQEEG